MAHDIGQTIQAIRKGAKLTQFDLAEKIGISHRQLQRIESGASDINMSTLVDIAEALGVSLSELTISFSESLKNKSRSEAAPGTGHRIMHHGPPNDANENLPKWAALVMDKIDYLVANDLERTRLQKRVSAIPDVFFAHWRDLPISSQALCLYILTRDEKLVSYMADEILKPLKSLLRSLEKDTSRTPR